MRKNKRKGSKCMTELKIFQNPDFGNVRTLEENGKILFCGKDVAKALGYKKTRNAITMHCKGALKRGWLTNGGVQEMFFVTEGDLYRLITHSRLPSAEKFERWVFDEVLPSIRKTGTYGEIDEIVKQCVGEVMKQIMPAICGQNRYESPAERALDAMFIKPRQVRQHYKLDKLPDDVFAEMIEKRLRDGMSYEELSEWVTGKGYAISRSAIHRFFSGMKVTDVYADRIELFNLKNEVITVFLHGGVIRRICG